MTDMVERVARAIYEGRNGRGAVPWSRRDAAHKAPYLADARAAIEAMREPTEGMLDAGSDGMSDGIGWSLEPGEGIDGFDASPVWRAMIAAALKP